MRSANAIAAGEGHFILQLLGGEASSEPYEVIFSEGEETVTLYDVFSAMFGSWQGNSIYELRSMSIFSVAFLYLKRKNNEILDKYC